MNTNMTAPPAPNRTEKTETAERRGARDGDGIGADLGEDSLGFGRSAQSGAGLRREAEAFSEKLRVAMRRGKDGEAGKDEDDARTQGQERVLAAVEPVNLAVFANPTAQPDAAEKLAKPSASYVDSLVQRVETAWRNELARPSDGAFHLQLRLEARETDAFKGLSLTITPTSLDVTLLGAGAPEAALVEAAQALAHRLHVRFPGRFVRVLGGVDDKAAARDGLAAISDFLRAVGGAA
jgi:hypothetical protein